MDMSPAVSYIHYAASSKEQTGDIIQFKQFEQGNLLYETHNLLAETRDCTEIGNKSDENSTMPPLISEEENDKMYSGEEFDKESMSMDML